jgi:prepilin-type N-terminal cleavage/methylation domain-containing protein
MSTSNRLTKKSRQGGFTLVEIAIVLVIIGLILGGVLQGQTMIENAKYKKFVKEVDSYRTAYYTFQDMYQALPGDMLNTTLLDASAVPGDGDGLIEGSTCTAATEESCKVWSHLRYAGLIPGDPATTGQTARPTHAYGAPVDSFLYTSGGNGISKNKMYINLVPGDVAQRYDNEYDDGDGNSGNISQSGNSSTYVTTGLITVVVEL